MPKLQTFSPEELIFLAVFVALAFAEEFDADDANVLGNWLVDIGGMLMTIAAQRQLIEQSQQPDVQQQIKELQNQVKTLEARLALQTGE